MNVNLALLKNSLPDFEIFLRIEKGLSENTLQAYLTDIKQCLNSLPEDKKEIPLSEIINLYFDEIQKDNELSSFTVARKLVALRALFKYLYDAGALEEFPDDILSVPKVHRKIPTVLTREEMNKVLEAITPTDFLTMRNRTLLELLYSSGLRVSEAVNLELHHIEKQEQMLRVLGKGNKERWIPYNNITANFLEIYLREWRPQVAKKESGAYVFLNRRGKKLTRQMVFYIVKDAVAKAGINKKVSPHTFRHSFATHLLEGGANIKEVAELLGHSHITTTEIYIHISKQHLVKTVKKYHPRWE